MLLPQNAPYCPSLGLWIRISVRLTLDRTGESPGSPNAGVVVPFPHDRLRDTIMSAYLSSLTSVSQITCPITSVDCDNCGLVSHTTPDTSSRHPSSTSPTEYSRSGLILFHVARLMPGCNKLTASIPPANSILPSAFSLRKCRSRSPESTTRACSFQRRTCIAES